MQREELEKAIQYYMATHNTISLASLGEDGPHAATVFYVNQGWDIFYLSSPMSKHSQNLSRNPKVAATINEDYDNWLIIKGIQLHGVVEQVGSLRDNIALARAYIKKFPAVADFFLAPHKLGEHVMEKVSRVRFYKLIPHQIYFINNEIGFGHRDELSLSHV